jgi:hypothetical protein
LWRLGQTFGEQWQRFVAGMEEQERSDQEIFERLMNDPRTQAALRGIIAGMRKKER